jgi:hypothetical protein
MAVIPEAVLGQEKAEAAPPVQERPQAEGAANTLSLFLFTQPLWRKEDQMLILPGEGACESNRQLLSTFLNYGGHSSIQTNTQV